MPLLGSDTADMGYSDLSFALVRWKDSLHLQVRSRRELEAWRLAILFRGFVWTQRSSFAEKGIGMSGIERLRQFLHPASERKGIFTANYR